MLVKGILNPVWIESLPLISILLLKTLKALLVLKSFPPTIYPKIAMTFCRALKLLAIPQTIKFEFSDNLIVESYQIFSSDPLIFRYVYQGEFIYDDSTGGLISARFDKATAMFFDPENGEEYGYTHLPTKMVVIQ